jgi:hypothetical protein
LCETLFAGCVKVFAEALELFTNTVFQFVIVDKTATSGCILQEAKSGSRWVLNRDCREDEREQSSPFLPLPPLCANWRAAFGVVITGTGLHLSSCLAEILELIVLTSLVTVHIALN